MKKFLALVMVLLLTLSLFLGSCAKAEIDEKALADLNEEVKDAFKDIDGYVPNNDRDDDDDDDDDRNDSYKDDNKGNYKDDEDDEQYDDGSFAKLNNKTPEQLYAEAKYRINALENLTLVASQDISMSNGAQTQTIKQAITQKFAGNDFSIVSSNELGEGEMNCQYVDGVVYNVQLNDGQRIKYEATKDQLYERMGIDPSESRILDIPESWFKDSIRFYEDEFSDRYYIKFSLDGSHYETFFKNAALFESVDISNIGDIEHIVYFTKDGDIDDMISTASLMIEGLNVTYVTTTVCKDIDNTVVEAPYNADDYRLVDISMIR